MRTALVLVLAALVIGGFLWLRGGDDASDSAAANGVLQCLNAAQVPATIETSSTGQRQVAVTHGPGQIGQNVTLQSSKTYVSFLESEEQAAWFEGQLRAAPGSSPDAVTHRGNAVVTFGTTASPAVRALISSCLAG
jgi:hypothetical protein